MTFRITNQIKGDKNVAVTASLKATASKKAIE